MVYYHCTPLRLRVGSIVEPGNWGRILHFYRTNAADNEMRLYREMAYEYARRLHAPAAPSRLSCVFACPTLEEAVAFRDAAQQVAVINAVEPVDEHVATHTTDYRLFGPPQGENMVGLSNAILAYWTVVPADHREVLIGGAVRIVAQH